MNSAAKSIYYFGYYLLLLGVILISFPNFLLSTFQMPETQEVWIRVIGIIVFNIGLYYIFMAPSNNQTFVVLTVYTRGVVLLWFVIFVLMKWAPVNLIGFGLVDAAGALWTYLAIKKL
jgi:hypothetical protein